MKPYTTTNTSVSVTSCLSLGSSIIKAIAAHNAMNKCMKYIFSTILRIVYRHFLSFLGSGGWSDEIESLICRKFWKFYKLSYL